MRRLSVVLMGLLVLALSGCGQKAQTPPPAAETPAETPAGTTEETPAGERNPTAAELGREETTELAFTVEGETELIPVTLYIGQGYSIYIPSEGWRLEKWVDDGIPEDTWESIVNDDVELTVSHYAGKTTMEARDAFVRDEDYVFEDLMGADRYGRGRRLSELHGGPRGRHRLRHLLGVPGGGRRGLRRPAGADREYLPGHGIRRERTGCGLFFFCAARRTGGGGHFSFEKRSVPHAPQRETRGIPISPRTTLKRHKGERLRPLPFGFPSPGTGERQRKEKQGPFVNHLESRSAVSACGGRSFLFRLCGVQSPCSPVRGAFFPFSCMKIQNPETLCRNPFEA